MQKARQAINSWTTSLFWDMLKRDFLIMDPPYQRRSVWNQDDKDYFVDTVLRGYPSPPIFLFREVQPEGYSIYSVVDGKQRLSALFDFANDSFPVSETASIVRFRGKYLKDLPEDVKLSFWGYRFAVEYVPSTDQAIINDIFERINRNVANLTPQELRHAKFRGEFVSTVEQLSEWMFTKLPQGIPSIPGRLRKHMKDDEFVTQLLLLIEEGPKKTAQEDLDKAFAERDQSWESKEATVTRFHDIVNYLAQLSQTEEGSAVLRSRLRYPDEFLSLFGAINVLIQDKRIMQVQNPVAQLANFVQIVEDPEKRSALQAAQDYWQAVCFASGDTEQLRSRIHIIQSVLLGGF